MDCECHNVNIKACFFFGGSGRVGGEAGEDVCHSERSHFCLVVLCKDHGLLLRKTTDLFMWAPQTSLGVIFTNCPRRLGRLLVSVDTRNCCKVTSACPPSLCCINALEIFRKLAYPRWDDRNSSEKSRVGQRVSWMAPMQKLEWTPRQWAGVTLCSEEIPRHQVR